MGYNFHEVGICLNLGLGICRFKHMPQEKRGKRREGGGGMPFWSLGISRFKSIHSRQAMAVADLISQNFSKNTQLSSTCPRDKHHEDGKALRLNCTHAQIKHMPQN